jgi:hypothetical protein
VLQDINDSKTKGDSVSDGKASQLEMGMHAISCFNPLPFNGKWPLI